MRGKFKYGWMHGDGVTPLFVWEKNGRWGVTRNFKKAKEFISISHIRVHYRSKRAFPEKYEESLENGYIMYYRSNGQLLLIY